MKCPALIRKSFMILQKHRMDIGERAKETTH